MHTENRPATYVSENAISFLTRITNANQQMMRHPARYVPKHEVTQYPVCHIRSGTH